MPEERRPLAREAALAALLSLCLALLVRWPAPLFLDTLPEDLANTAHHAALFSGVAASIYVGVDFMAWQLHLLYDLVAPLSSRLGAFQLALILWLVVTGLSGWVLGLALGWGRAARLAAVVAFVANPMNLQFIQNGRGEHLVLPFLVLILLGTRVPGMRGALLSLAGLVAAANSSPYQAVPAGVLLLCGGLVQGPRRLLRSVGVALVAALPTLLLWTDVDPGAQGVVFPVGLAELFWSAPSVEPVRMPATVNLHQLYLLPAPPHEQYLGLVLTIAGGVGLFRARRQPWARAAALAGVVCLLLALGYQLHLTADGPALAWLPWSWIATVDVLSRMHNTTRFLTGTGFILAVGLAACCRRPAVAAVVSGALLVEVLLFAPGAWPARLVTLEADMFPAPPADCPVLVWPPEDYYPHGTTDLLGLSLGQPLLSLRSDQDPGAVEDWLAEVGPQEPCALVELVLPPDEDPAPAVPYGFMLVDQTPMARLWLPR